MSETYTAFIGGPSDQKMVLIPKDEPSLYVVPDMEGLLAHSDCWGCGHPGPSFRMFTYQRIYIGKIHDVDCFAYIYFGNGGRSYLQQKTVNLARIVTQRYYNLVCEQQRVKDELSKINSRLKEMRHK